MNFVSQTISTVNSANPKLNWLLHETATYIFPYEHTHFKFYFIITAKTPFLRLRLTPRKNKII